MNAKKIQTQNLRLEARYKKLKELAAAEFQKLKKFIEKSKNGEGKSGVDISEQTERKYVDVFTIVLKNVEGEICKLTKDDLTELKQNLKSGKIKSRFKQPYSLTTIREIGIVLMGYLEDINPKKYSSFRKWFIIKVPRKSVERLKEAEIEKLYNNCKNNRERFLIAVLFDSGFRSGEFLNIRAEDITAPTTDFPYYKIFIKHEYSKTEERNIGMYWKRSTEAIRTYLEELGELNPQEAVYKKSYDSVRIFLTRLGQRILGKRIHFHIFRKSSASYYATKLKSRQNLCYRYGWKFSSDVPDVYINREQGEEEVKDGMVNTSLEKLQKENQELQTKMALLTDDLVKVTKTKVPKKIEIVIKDKEGVEDMKKFFSELENTKAKENLFIAKSSP